MRSRRLVPYSLLLFSYIFVLAPPLKGADCQDYLKLSAPKVRIAKKYRPSIGSMLIINLSLKPNNLNEQDLATLACHLQSEYSAQDELLVRIFDNFKAAKAFDGIEEGMSSATHLGFRAEYGYKKQTKRQEMRWRPDSGSQDGANWVPINLDNLPDPAERRATQVRSVNLGLGVS